MIIAALVIFIAYDQWRLTPWDYSRYMYAEYAEEDHGYMTTALRRSEGVMADYVTLFGGVTAPAPAPLNPQPAKPKGVVTATRVETCGNPQCNCAVIVFTRDDGTVAGKASSMLPFKIDEEELDAATEEGGEPEEEFDPQLIRGIFMDPVEEVQL